MKRFYLITMLMCFCGIAAMAQTPTATPGPATTAGLVCRVTHTGTKPGKNAEFIKFRREHAKPILDEQKKQGLIVSYTYYSKPINLGPDDWDLALVVCFKNYADAIDANAERDEKLNQIGLKHYGSAEARTKANNSLNDLRDVVSSILMREQILNPIP
jgi:hypothetical protein